MIKSKTRTKINRQEEIALAFMAGVNWTLTLIVDCGEVFNMTEKDAQLIRDRAWKYLHPNTAPRNPPTKR